MVKPKLLPSQLSGILLAPPFSTVSLAPGYLPFKMHEREYLSPNCRIKIFPFSLISPENNLDFIFASRAPLLATQAQC